MLRVRSSRRVTGLKPADYDHEIGLIDHDKHLQGTRSPNGGDGPIERMDSVSTSAQLLPSVGEGEELQLSQSAQSEQTLGENGRIQERPAEELENEQNFLQTALRPSIEIQEPTPDVWHGGKPNVKPKKPHIERETAIDILYENERGGWLCGRPLFASAALGSLDPPAWTNAYHKPSPTSIHTAQVPDPSWEWVWSEWHINKQEGVDDDGWEYSFAFSKKFSWHPARWWNSFVRRRAWTRKRAKKQEEDVLAGPHMLNADYFTVRSASERGSRGSNRSSRASSRVPSRSSLSQMSSTEMAQVRPDIEDVESLLQILRFARIDREKLEAAMNYLEHAMDLINLEKEMHEIMSLFIFQASRRLLLGHLMKIYDEATEDLEKEDTTENRDRKSALEAAVRHADEEVRRLAYWSDIKEMAESGESRGAVDGRKGWNADWQGVDQSGPMTPNKGKAPEEV